MAQKGDEEQVGQGGWRGVMRRIPVAAKVTGVAFAGLAGIVTSYAVAPEVAHLASETAGLMWTGATETAAGNATSAGAGVGLLSSAWIAAYRRPRTTWRTEDELPVSRLVWEVDESSPRYCYRPGLGGASTTYECTMPKGMIRPALREVGVGAMVVGAALLVVAGVISGIAAIPGVGLESFARDVLLGGAGLAAAGTVMTAASAQMPRRANRTPARQQRGLDLAR